jgi:hypothetical protein
MLTRVGQLVKFHESPRSSLLIATLLTPNINANSTLLQFPVFLRSRMALAHPHPNLEFAQSSGLCLGARRFSFMSAMLSACVPRNRWDGLTHDGLSHRWHTHIPSAIGPLCNSHEYRCAFLRTRSEMSQ